MSIKTPEQKARDAANMRAWRARNRERARENDRRCKARNAAAVKETKKRSYLKHRDANLAYAAEYRSAHRDEIRAKLRDGKNSEYQKRYRERHPEKARAMTQAWKDANPERRKAGNAAWAKRNADKRRVDAQNRRRRAGTGKLSANIGPRLYALQKGRCACCGQSLKSGYEMDHIMPLHLGGEHADWNIQLLTMACNRRKRAQHPISYMQSKGMLL